MPVHVVPDRALHVSLYALVPFSWPDEAKEPFWRATQGALLELWPELVRACSGLELHCEGLRIFPSAVIASLQERSDAIRALRERVALAYRHPSLPAPRYDSLHCTLARFSTSAALASGEREALEAQALPLSTPLSGLALVRERRYPSLEVDDVMTASFPASAVSE